MGANAGTNQTISFSIDSALAADLSYVGTVVDAPNGIAVSGSNITGPLGAGDLIVNGKEIGSSDGTAGSLAAAINTANADGDPAVADIATPVNVQKFDFETVVLGNVTQVGSDTINAAGSAGVASTLTSNGITLSADAVGAGGDAVTLQVVRGDAAVMEQQTITFGALGNNESVLIGGMTVTDTTGAGQTAAATAAAFAAFAANPAAVVAGFSVTNDFTASGFTAAASVSGAGSNELVITATTAGEKVELADTGTAGSSTVAETRADVAADATGVDTTGNAITVTIADAAWSTTHAAAIAALVDGENPTFGTVTASGDTTLAAEFGPTPLAGGEDTADGELVISGLTNALADGVNNVALTLNGVDLTVDTTGVTDLATLATAITASNAAITATADSAAGTITVVSTAGAIGAGTEGALQTSTVGAGDSYALSLDGGATLDFTSEALDGSITAEEVAAKISGETGYSAIVNDEGQIEVTRATGVDFALAETITGGTGAGLSNLDGTDASGTYHGQIQLDGDANIFFTEAEGSGALAASGLATAGNATTTIDLVTVDTRDNAWIAIASVDAALEDIDTIRGGLGAVQNRFESTIANLNNVSENLSAARSRILDADIAQETSAMTKSNILQQAGVAILSQANQTPQLALQLLQG